MTTNFGATFRNSKWADFTLKNVNPLSNSFEMNPLLNKINVFVIFFAILIFSKFNSPIFDPTVLNFLIASWDFIDAKFHLSETLFVIVPLVTQYGFLVYVKYFFTSFWSLRGPLNKFFDSNFPINQPLLKIRDSFQKEISGIEKLSVSEPYRFEWSLYRAYLSLPFTYSLSPGLNINLLHIKPEYYGIIGNGKYEFSPSLDKCIKPVSTFNHFKIYNKGTPFYIPQSDYQKISSLSSLSETFNIYHPLKLQSLLSNMVRWAYKYNTLHRRSIHNSHKLTSVKRLLSLGYFDFNIVDANVWFSDQYGRDLTHAKISKSSSSKSILQKSWELLYRSNFNNPFSNPIFVTGQTFLNSSNQFKNLSFYESSFHFFLKRTKLYLTLNSQSIKLRPNTRSNFIKGSIKADSLKSIYPLISTLNLQNSFGFGIHKFYNQLRGFEKNYSSNSKDVLLSRFDKIVWTPYTLETLYNITQTQSLLKQDLNFYIYISYGHVDQGQEYTRYPSNNIFIENIEEGSIFLG
jgi:hypothetical protein